LISRTTSRLFDEDINTVTVHCVVETRDAGHIEALKARLNQEGVSGDIRPVSKAESRSTAASSISQRFGFRPSGFFGFRPSDFGFNQRYCLAMHRNEILLQLRELPTEMKEQIRQHNPPQKPTEAESTRTGW